MNVRPNPVAQALGDLAIEMQAQADSEATLRTIVAAASDILPGISWAGVALVRSKTVTPGAATDEVAQALDRVQSDLGEGPVIDALAVDEVVFIADLSSEARWPRFTAAAGARGVFCLASFRLFVRDETLGALTLYGPAPGVIDDEVLLYGQLLAQHAAVAMAGSRVEDQLTRAVASRDIIGQAKGILMERYRLNAIRAFGLLTRLSQESNIKLIEVAKNVIDTTDTGPE